jgi:hypothetical protein
VGVDEAGVAFSRSFPIASKKRRKGSASTRPTKVNTPRVPNGLEEDMGTDMGGGLDIQHLLSTVSTTSSTSSKTTRTVSVVSWSDYFGGVADEDMTSSMFPMTTTEIRLPCPDKDLVLEMGHPPPSLPRSTSTTSSVLPITRDVGDQEGEDMTSTVLPMTTHSVSVIGLEEEEEEGEGEDTKGPLSARDSAQVTLSVLGDGISTRFS